MICGQIAEELSSKLRLDHPPIALAFVEAAPSGIPTFNQDVPSACSFWRQAESHVFYASAEQHYNCPIGAMTMGFHLPDHVQENLKTFVQKMSGCGYLSLEEPGGIPSIEAPKTGIVYGPLKDFSLEPDLIVMWLRPSQAMLYSEATGGCNWASTSPTAVFGRPACAALSVAFQQSQSALSLGCAGMRTFTEIQEDRLLVVLPGAKAREFVLALDATVNANESMHAFYQEHKAGFAS